MMLEMRRITNLEAYSTITECCMGGRFWASVYISFVTKTSMCASMMDFEHTSIISHDMPLENVSESDFD
jgi:hypothetical protein